MQEWRDDCVFGKARKNTREKLVGKFLGLCDYVIVLGELSLAQRPELDPGFSHHFHIPGVQPSQLGPLGAVGLALPLKLLISLLSSLSILTM